MASTHVSPRSWNRGFTATLVLVALVDALAVSGVLAAWAQEAWAIVAGLLVALVVVNVVYLSRRRFVAAKYLVPGLAFLLVFQVFVILYTAYASMTNYGDGHNSTRADAVHAILVGSVVRVPGSPAFPVTVVDRDGTLGFLTQHPEDGSVLLGSSDEPLRAVPDAVLADGRPTPPPGYTALTAAELFGRQDEVLALAVPVEEDLGAGLLRTTDGTTAVVVESLYSYDETAGTLVRAGDGQVFADSGRGSFQAADGETLQPGWTAFVGLDNFASVLTDPTLRGPFLGVLLWTFAYATASVALAFGLGLGLAFVLNSPVVRGRRLYRSLLIFPYAFPAFLSAMVWQGMLNPRFGFVNQTLLGGASIEWLDDPWLARASVLVVNLWMGLPYMFLVCTGAIQALPAELDEAAKVDGAGWVRALTSIKLPLLLVSVAPLLIASFALNFNNFNSIYLLTGGGPLEHPTDQAGATDILISFVYRLAFGGVNRQYGLACAISILIFLIVAGISALSFRRTRTLEELS